ncbi:MAG TPA: hypothetical protein VLX85_15370 [Stellaceae bacterium]|nr:hypothetical protein [Stellaceae bacterium]
MAVLVSALLVATAGSAAADCADDVAALNIRVPHLQKTAPTPQTAAASKELAKLNKNLPQMDEFQCINAVARVRRALTESPPDDQAAQKP